MINKVIPVFLFLVLSGMITNAQWAAQKSNTTENLHDVYFTDAKTGVVVGNKGTILKTTAGGSTWNKITSPSSGNLHAVFFSAPLNGYIAGDSGIILKTTDGGNSWNKKTSTASTILNTICFLNDNEGFAAGDNGVIIKTTDGGNSWKNVASPTVYILHKIIFTNNKQGYAVGAKGTVLKTEDGGNTWTVKTTPVIEALYSIDFFNDSSGYVAGTNGTILKTTDYGNSWTAIADTIFKREMFTTIKAIAAGKWLAAGNNGVFVKSFKDDTLLSYLTSVTTSGINAVFFTSPDTGYATGANGTVLKTTNGGGVSVEEISAIEKFNVFPNPCKNSTSVSYCLQKKAQVRMELYDIMGEKAGILLNKEQISGNHTFSFNPALYGCSTGVYLLKVTANNRPSLVFRLVVIQ